MTFEELSVGDRAELTRTVTEEDVTLFARVTGDLNPVHVDPEAAARSPFGERIAHGMLVAGLVSAVLGTKLPGPGCVYVEQSLRFVRPVHFGDTVTARAEVRELVAETRRVRLATVCRNQRGEVVLKGEAVVMVPGNG
jgi:acyl dehydratase